MQKNLRDNILYYPGYPDDPGQIALPLICRSVTRFSGPAGAQGNDVAKSYWHLEWVVEGTLLMQTPNAEHRIEAGQAVVVPPGVQRRFAAADPVSGRGLSFLGEQAEGILRTLGYSHPGTLQPGDCPTNDFLQLQKEIGGMTDRDMRDASATAYRILTKAFRRIGAANGEDAARDPLVSRALQLLDKSFSNPAININWIASKLGCHRCYLSHRFRQKTGMTPGEYLMRRRLQKAMNRLRTSSDKVADIAMGVGFSSPDYFSRVFQNKIGTTPTRFRRDG
jgi:AraC-like DNA-binding protein